jgi:hypothetical protein
MLIVALDQVELILSAERYAEARFRVRVAS